MNPGLLELEKPEDLEVESRARWFRGRADAHFENLEEDTTLPRGQSVFLTARQPEPSLETERPRERPDRAVAVPLDETSRVPPRSGSLLRASLEVLGELRADAMVADWLEAASVLKRDVSRLRRSNYARHGAILLALADALTFTVADEVADGSVTSLISHALGLLSEPFIREDDEAEFLGGLLTAGWNLAPSES